MIKFIPLPDDHAPKRDINFTTKEEALMIANTFDDGINTDVQVSQFVPEAVNTQADGRKWHQVQFNRPMTLNNSLNRRQRFVVPFDLNAGIVLDDEVNNPLLPWEYLAESTGTDTWTGDVERSDGQ